MNSSDLSIVFTKGDLLQTLYTRVVSLKKEQGREVMHTICGVRLFLEDVISVNGIRFAC